MCRSPRRTNPSRSAPRVERAPPRSTGRGALDRFAWRSAAFTHRFARARSRGARSRGLRAPSRAQSWVPTKTTSPSARTSTWRSKVEATSTRSAPPLAPAVSSDAAAVSSRAVRVSSRLTRTSLRVPRGDVPPRGHALGGRPRVLLRRLAPGPRHLLRRACGAESHLLEPNIRRPPRQRVRLRRQGIRRRGVQRRLPFLDAVAAVADFDPRFHEAACELLRGSMRHRSNHLGLRPDEGSVPARTSRLFEVDPERQGLGGSKTPARNAAKFPGSNDEFEYARCWNDTASIFVTIVDVCPCSYSWGNNACAAVRSRTST